MGTMSVSWWDKTDGKDQPLMRISHEGGQTFGEAILLTAISTSSSSQMDFRNER